MSQEPIVLKRKAYDKMLAWKSGHNRTALLITGARQVGKTYLVREFAKDNYESFVELNLILNADAAGVFQTPSSPQEIIMRLSLLAEQPLIPGNTLIFIDEIQSYPEVMTVIKGLIDQTQYDFVLSGSLLGVELHDIRSQPVGYLTEITMYPLDFEEFCWASHVDDAVFDTLRDCFDKLTPVDSFIHEHLLKLFRRYVVVGGMPDCVSTFIVTNDLGQVRSIQEDIRTRYRADISQYCPEALKLKAKQAYDLVPSELSNPNKRFIIKSLSETARFRTYEDAFIWLTYANVALAAYNVTEPCGPLLLSKERNLFKLFYSDVGLLTGSYLRNVTLDVLDNGLDMNFGSTFENAVAQELTAHGFDPYYYNSKKFGELDFVIEDKNGTIYPIEVKSGKNYTRHKALLNVLEVKNYDLSRGYVLCPGNVEQEDRVVYLPIYMVGLFQND